MLPEFKDKIAKLETLLKLKHVSSDANKKLIFKNHQL